MVVSGGEEFAGENADEAVGRIDDDAHLGIEVGEDLTILPARALHPAPVATDRNDVSRLGRTGRPSRRERDGFCARATGEVIEIHPGEGPAVRHFHRGTHRVDAVLTRACIRRRIDCLPGQFDQRPIPVGHG